MMCWCPLNYKLSAHVLLLTFMCCTVWENGRALRIVGTWSSINSPFLILAKFGFQQIDPLDAEFSGGFVYGNVSTTVTSGARGILLVAPKELISGFLTESVSKRTCDSLLQNISSVVFDSKCFPNGEEDIMRYIPCPVGELCPKDSTLEKIIGGSQLTIRIKQFSLPEYWYLLLVACYLDDHCLWKSSVKAVDVQYDLWLTNGSPLISYSNPFALQFSFEEQNSVEIYIVFLLLFVVIAFCQWRSVVLSNCASVLPRHQLLNFIIILKTFGLALLCSNVVVFSINGQGIFFARLLGEMACLTSICLIYLLLILLSSGWSFSINSEISLYHTTVIIWGLFSAAQLLLFLFNFFFVNDVLQDVNIFKSWPDYVIIVIRMAQAIWFLVKIRHLINQDDNTDKAIFLAHFGAGFLVWFVYILGLGIIASYISALWRFKVILGITTMADFVAVACLVHLFWPTSPNRSYFLADNTSHKRFTLVKEDGDDNFETLLISESAGGETDSSVCEMLENI